MFEYNLVAGLTASGADTYVINNNPNGLNINNNAGSTHIEGLHKFVVEKGLDVGFAYDGDADRCLCVDEKGNVITGDHILYIYGCYIKERGKLLNNTVVTTVMSNFGLYKAFNEQGISYARPLSSISMFMSIWPRTAAVSAVSKAVILLSSPSMQALVTVF